MDNFFYKIIQDIYFLFLQKKLLPDPLFLEIRAGIIVLANIDNKS